MIDERIYKINQVVKEYFRKNSKTEVIPAKDLMPEFIAAGIYDRDHRNGLPIRKDLRDLDDKGQLVRIPFVHVVRKNVNRSWYFIPSGVNVEDVNQKLNDSSNTRSSKKKSRTSRTQKYSDEKYILDLCDEVLGRKGLRQHRFEFLLGDLHSNGKTRTKLPCDIYYPDLNLVVEYNERQHTESVKHFDKPDRKTVSGVHRGEQRRRYDERRRKVLPENGFTVIDLSYFDFEHTGKRRLKRIREQDLAIVKQTLKKKGTEINAHRKDYYIDSSCLIPTKLE